MHNNALMANLCRRQQLNLHRSSYKISDFYQIWIFSTFPNIKFHGNPSMVSRTDTWGQTDGRDEINGRFSQLIRRQLKHENSLPCSREPFSWKYLEPIKYKQSDSIKVLILLTYYIPSASSSSAWSFLFWCCEQKVFVFLFSPMHATLPTHINPLYLLH